MITDWSAQIPFHELSSPDLPDTPGVYVVFDGDKLLHVGMAGRDGRGSLRRRLRDHRDGNMVNMLKQYLWFALVQHLDSEPARTPQEAARRCRAFMMSRLSFRYLTCADGAHARAVESEIKRGKSKWGTPTLNGTGFEA